MKLITKNVFYNKLNLINKKQINKKKTNYKIKNLYYPQYGQMLMNLKIIYIIMN